MTTELTQLPQFEIDVSRVARNKEGYENGYKLNTSFQTENHTAKTLIDTVIKEGWPYTMAHVKHSPQATGADARGVTTPKHIENFRSMQVCTFDDDSGKGNVVQFWLSDPFFSKFGWAFVESASSNGSHCKGHPTFIFDVPVTDPKLYKEILQAFCTAYPRLDWLVDITRTIYNGQGATVHKLGNHCPLDEFVKHFVEPYRAEEERKQAAIEAARAERQAAREKAKADGKTVSSSYAEATLRGLLTWMFDKVANTSEGCKPSRNGAIYWAGRWVAGAEASPWTAPHAHLFSDVEQRIEAAADANGYLSDYANDSTREVLRIFERGRAKGGEELEEPIPGDFEVEQPPIDKNEVAPPIEGDDAQDGVDVGADADAGSVAFLLSQTADDEGNAQCVNHLHGDRLAHCDAYGWMAYNGRYWERQSEEIANGAIIDTLIKRRVAAVKGDREAIVKATRGSAKRVRDCKYMLKRLVRVDVADFDKSADLLNCQNGVVDLRSGEIAPHDAAQRFTYCTPVEFRPDAQSAEWERYLGNVLSDNAELMRYLQEAIGYSLTGHTWEECLFYLYGEKRSGKGTFTETILTALGRLPIATEVDFTSFTMSRDKDAQNFDLAPLKPCRVVMASESDKYQRLNAGKVKALTGGNDIRCAFKHKTHFSYRPQFKIWLSSNWPVNADVDDDAIWSRVRVIHFPNCYLGREDKRLKFRLAQPENLQGVLAWAVRGSMAWYGRGVRGLDIPPQVAKATKQARADIDYVAQWVEESIVKTDDGKGFVRNSTLYARYDVWCRARNIKPKGQRGLTIALKGKGYQAGERNKEGTARGVNGVKLVPGAR